MYITIPNAGKLITQLNIDSNIQSNKSSNKSTGGINFLELLVAILDEKDAKLDFLPQKIERGYEKEAEMDKISLLGYIYGNSIFPLQSLPFLDGEKADLSLGDQKVNEQITSITSLMKPGDEIIFNIDNREILIKKDLQSQVFVCINYKDMESIIKTNEITQTIEKRLNEIKEENKIPKVVQGIGVKEDGPKAEFIVRPEEIIKKIQVNSEKEEILEEIAEIKTVEDIWGKQSLENTEGKGELVEVIRREPKIDNQVRIDTDSIRDRVIEATDGKLEVTSVIRREPKIDNQVRIDTDSIRDRAI
ncbi:MAG: hypothetical protein N2380_01795, partial [bacterium]|nr:hypothetical protein [bacterium]